jgi:hypothetical protein
MVTRESSICASSPKERDDALKLLVLFRDRMQSSDGSLETLIYKAAPELGMVVKRATIYQWFIGRNGISPKMYPAVRAFIRSKLFQQRVPEARAFSTDAQTAVLEVGQIIASRTYTKHPADRRRAALRQLRGYHYSRVPTPARLGAICIDGGGIRIDFVEGYDFGVFAAYDKGRNSTYLKYVFHDVSDEPIRCPMNDFVLPRGSDVYVLDVVERADRRPIKESFWLLREGTASTPNHWGGRRLSGDVGPPLVEFVGPLPQASNPERISTETQRILDMIIWDVAAHGITKP